MVRDHIIIHPGPETNSQPVLVDKPVTATANDAQELGELAKSKGLVLYPFQNRRWDSDFLALQHLLAQTDTLGAITEFESQCVSSARSISMRVTGFPA